MPIGPELDPLEYKHTDFGPVYAETNYTRLIAEPWNAASAFLFVLIVAYWAVRLRGRYRDYRFLCTCLILLLLGGVGGTIYHAFRRSAAMFLLDVVPIFLLVVLGSFHLLVRLGSKRWHLILVGVLFVLLQIPSGAGKLSEDVAFLKPVAEFLGPQHHIAIMMSYLMLSVLILVPIGLVEIRTRGRHVNQIALALVIFGQALIWRYIDVLRPPALPMGTHWLWHVGGAVTTAILAHYFYRIQGEALEPPVTASPVSRRAR